MTCGQEFEFSIMKSNKKFNSGRQNLTCLYENPQHLETRHYILIMAGQWPPLRKFPKEEFDKSLVLNENLLSLRLDRMEFPGGIYMQNGVCMHLDGSIS